MRVHHLNCGLMCPPGGRLFDGFSRGAVGRLACHCLLVEMDDSLVLVDTGFGLKDVEAPHRRISTFFLYLDNIQLEEEMTALRQVEALGYRPRDVQHIVMTHLDFDHAGGLQDFPWARIHVMEAELEAAARRSGPRESRYSPEQLKGLRHWVTYGQDGARWNGFRAVRALEGLPPDILLVSLPGHTEGHAGVAVQDGDGWLLHAADSYFHRHEMDRPERECPLGARAYQRLMAVDFDLHLENQSRLRELYRDPHSRIAVFCTHDLVELAALQGLEGRSRPVAPQAQRRREEAAPSKAPGFSQARQ